MNIENTKAQMRKGVLEYCILSILSGDDKYASEILETLKDAKMLVVEGTISATAGKNPAPGHPGNTTGSQRPERYS